MAKTTTIRISKELNDRLKAVAEKERRSTNSMGIIAIEDLVEKHEAANDKG